MSAITGNSVLKYIVSVGLTAILVALCWYIWEETPGWIRRTPLQDYRFLVSLLAIYLVLSLLNPLIGKFWNLLFSPRDAEGEGR